MKRHKHVYEPVAFIRDPTIYAFYQCEVEEKCECGKVCRRQPTWTEYEEEIKSMTCVSCGMLLRDHDVNGCLASLAKKIVDLEDRLAALEKWRNG